MARVRSVLPNQPEECSGVRFSGVPGNMVSEEVSEDVAAHFCMVPGFMLVEEAQPTQVVPKTETRARSGPRTKARTAAKSTDPGDANG